MAAHLPRFAGLCPKRGKLRKVAVHLPRLAGEATGGSPATVSRFEPRKKVWLNLLASAGEWSLIKPAACGWCSPVCNTCHPIHFSGSPESHPICVSGNILCHHNYVSGFTVCHPNHGSAFTLCHQNHGNNLTSSQPNHDSGSTLSHWIQLQVSSLILDL